MLRAPGAWAVLIAVVGCFVVNCCCFFSVRLWFVCFGALLFGFWCLRGNFVILWLILCFFNRELYACSSMIVFDFFFINYCFIFSESIICEFY